jgi:hypothetical protein
MLCRVLVVHVHVDVLTYMYNTNSNLQAAVVVWNGTSTSILRFDDGAVCCIRFLLVWRREQHLISQILNTRC